MPTLPPPRRFTIAERLTQYGADARARLKPYFAAAHVAYPPARVALVGLKQERELFVYVAGPDGVMRWLRSYPILAASGRLGPKLKAGDKQVPEGVYAIESLNPNSRFHLSLRVGYPNAFDLAQANRDDRTDLGGDIMIHGADLSIGCLAMGRCSTCPARRACGRRRCAPSGCAWRASRCTSSRRRTRTGC